MTVHELDGASVVRTERSLQRSCAGLDLFGLQQADAPPTERLLAARADGIRYARPMVAAPNRWTWIAGSDPGVVCRAYLAFIPEREDYVCSVLTSATLVHHFGLTADEAEQAARRYVESQHGPIRRHQQLARMKALRIARWNGVPALVGGEHALPLDEEWVRQVAHGNATQARGYFVRIVMTAFPEETHKREHALVKQFVAQDDWSAVPVDALFAWMHPDLDYQPE